MTVNGYTLDYSATDSATNIDVTFRYVYAEETFSSGSTTASAASTTP